VVVLGVSAWWESDIRRLHFFQAWMYVAAMVLSLRSNRWGYFIGASAAGLWDYANIVATTFFLNGLEQMSQWVHTGHLARPDILIAVPAWFSNLLLICRVPLGLFAAAGQTAKRYRQVFGGFRPNHRLLGRRHGYVPTSLSRPLSPHVAPASAVRLPPFPRLTQF